MINETYNTMLIVKKDWSLLCVEKTATRKKVCHTTPTQEVSSDCSHADN